MKITLNFNNATIKPHHVHAAAHILHRLAAVIAVDWQSFNACDLITAEIIQTIPPNLASEVRVNALYVSLSAIIYQLHQKGPLHLQPNRAGHLF